MYTSLLVRARKERELRSEAEGEKRFAALASVGFSCSGREILYVHAGDVAVAGLCELGWV